MWWGRRVECGDPPGDPPSMDVGSVERGRTQVDIENKSPPERRMRSLEGDIRGWSRPSGRADMLFGKRGCLMVPGAGRTPVWSAGSPGRSGGGADPVVQPKRLSRRAGCQPSSVTPSSRSASSVGARFVTASSMPGCGGCERVVNVDATEHDGILTRMRFRPGEAGSIALSGARCLNRPVRRCHLRRAPRRQTDPVGNARRRVDR